MPDFGLSVASPLYLMMLEVKRKKMDLSVTETSASKSRAKVSVVREPGMSVTDMAKKLMNKLSVNLSNKLDDGQRLFAQDLESPGLRM